MSDSDYWRKRLAWDMYEQMADAEDRADLVARVYRSASSQIVFSAQDIFEKYVTKHKLSKAEAWRLLNSIKDKDSIDKLIQELKNRDAGENKDLIKELEAPAYRFRLERLQEILQQVDAVMQNVYQQEQQFDTSFFEQLSENAYYKSIYNIQRRTGFGFSFSKIDQKQIDHALKINWSGKHYSKRIWKNTDELARTVKDELLVSLLTGRTERETAAIITEKFGGGASKARRLIRTESCFFSNELNAQAYEECGLKKYQLLATLDLRTSKICRPLDGRKFLLKDRQVGKNYPPLHPWCRCTTIVYISEDALKNLKRRAHNPKTGKTEMVPASMTYSQWYEKYVKNDPKALAQEKAIKNAASDRKQYEKYQEVLGDDIPKSFVKFQKLKYNEPEKWEELKTFYRDANRYQKLIDESGNLNIKGQPIKKINRIKLDEYEFKDNHINSEREHQVTKELAQKYVNESVAAYRRWNGDVTVYVSKYGATVANHREKTISTAYRSSEYNPKFNKLLEVLKIDKVSTD